MSSTDPLLAASSVERSYQAPPDLSVAPSQALLRAAQQAADSLVLFGNVLADAIGQAYLACVAVLQQDEDTGRSVVRLYTALFGVLADWWTAQPHNTPAQSLHFDLWQVFLIEQLLTDENPWTLLVQRPSSFQSMRCVFDEAVRHDLRVMQSLYQCHGGVLHAALVARCEHNTIPPAWGDFPLPSADHASIAQHLVSADDWGVLLPEIVEYLQRHGTGRFAAADAFRWERGRGLCAVSWPDVGVASTLVGYDEQRAALAQNTERLLHGAPAHDVLLYGARGTGKSSAIKALLPRYAAQGLRLIEVPRDAVADIGEICGLLRGRAGAFILFIDDLSFEEGETQYKDLKALLEGSIMARPPNVRIYATSNRRHLIKERFADRAGPLDDDLHLQDSVQEKLSLSDRFGLALLFLPPDQPLFLHIVEELAHQRGLRIDPQRLRAEALRATQWHSGRSGRVARQIIDDMEAELLAQPPHDSDKMDG